MLVRLFACGTCLALAPSLMGAIYNYTDGLVNATPIVISEDSDFNIESGSAEQSGSVTTTSSGLSISKYGEGTLHFTGQLNIDSYFFPGVGTVTSSANGSFIDYLGVDSFYSELDAPVFAVTGGSTTIGAIYVGTYGTGELHVTGGTLDNHFSAASLGYDNGASGFLLVDGPGAHFITDYLEVGVSGSGVTTLRQGGRITTTESDGFVWLGTSNGGYGVLNLGSASGQAPTAVGVLDTSKLTGGPGGGMVVFNHDGSYYFTSDSTSGGDAILIEGNAQVRVENGVTHFLANNTYTGGTLITGGVLVVEGSIGDVTVQTMGMLSGTGMVGAIVLQDGALAPGDSAGTLTGESLDWQSGVLLYDLGANAAQSDFLALSGELTGSVGTLSFEFYDNGWLVGETYDLIGFDSTTLSIGQFAYINDEDFAGVFSYSGGGMLQFTLTQVPEPAGLALTAGLLALAFVSRRGKCHQSAKRR